MGKFRKKAIEIWADQYRHPAEQIEGVCFCEAGCPVASVDESESAAHVHTIHAGQICLLEPGDWIVPEPDGEHYYPIKPEIFAATYDRLTFGS